MQLLEQRQVRRPLSVTSGEGVRQQLAQGVHALQQQRDERAVDRERSIAKLFQQIFESVREGAERIESDDGGIPLQRVTDPEDQMERLVILRARLEVDQGLLHGGEPLLGLRREGLKDEIPVQVYRIAHGGATPRRI